PTARTRSTGWASASTTEPPPPKRGRGAMALQIRRVVAPVAGLVLAVGVAAPAGGSPAAAPRAGVPAAATASPPWMDRSLSPARRAALVLAQMTLDEKIAEVHGVG